MRRTAFVLGTGLALTGGGACTIGSGPANLAQVLLGPVLDSIFVGDSLTPRAVTYIGDNGQPQDPGPITWSSGDASVLQVNPATGQIVARKAGFALVIASARGVTGNALVVVSRPVDIALQLDTLVLMPGDTISIPFQVRHKAAGTPSVWFTTAANDVFTIDSAGKDSAETAGGPLPFQAFAALGADTVADTGAVRVVRLTDTTGGVGAYTILGSVIRRVTVAAQATNYQRAGDTLTFRLQAFLAQGTVTAEAVVVTIRSPLAGPAALAIDSISPTEALGAGFDPVCRPPRDWASWSTLVTAAPIVALSRPAGSITVTQIIPVTGGFAISGRFSFLAQRTDFYDDPLGVLPIRGTFVAPLTATTGRC